MTGLRARWDIAFAQPLTGWIAALVVAILVVGALVIGLLQLAGRLSPELRRELWLRLGSWSLLAPAMGLPILVGRLWVISAVMLLGLACFREYGRATGLFRERFVSFFVVLGIFAVNLAAADHWYAFFMALIPLSCGFIAVASIPFDHPQGYVQRVALGVFAFFLFGTALAHLGYMSTTPTIGRCSCCCYWLWASTTCSPTSSARPSADPSCCRTRAPTRRSRARWARSSSPRRWSRRSRARFSSARRWTMG